MSSIGSIGSSGCNPLQQAMRQLFSKSDANTDGKLDTSEISSLLDTLQTDSTSGSSLTSDSIVTAFDTDGDGSVSGSEFDAGFKKLGDDMQSTMIAMQEGGQMPPPPPGPPPGMSSSEDDEDEDSSTSTVSDLLKLLENYSSSETASTDEDDTTTAASTDTLLQTFLSQLEKYAKTQDYKSTYQSQYSSGVSLSA